MKSGEWEAWLQGWLKRHPLRTPPEGLQQEIRQTVMARIRSQEVPAYIRTLRWTLQPRWGLAWSGALAAALVAALLILPARPPDRASSPASEEVAQEAQLLLEMGEAATLAELDLEGELEEADRLMLADASAQPASSGTELEADLELLDLLEEEEAGSGEADRLTDEELLEELHSMDEAEMALS